MYMATALQWTTYGDLHRKDPVKVLAGKCKGKSKATKRRYKAKIEDHKFNQAFGVWTTRIAGIVILTWMMVAVFTTPEQYDTLSQVVSDRFKNLTAPYGVTYKRVEQPKELLKGFVEVAPVKAEEPQATPTPTVAPVVQEPVKDKAYYMGAIREEAQKAGVKKELSERLILLIDKCENGRWDPKAKHDNRKEDGTVWSTDYGITMVNDYWHAGRVESIYGLPYKQVLTDGDLNIHYAIHYIVKPQGHLNAWACNAKVK